MPEKERGRGEAGSPPPHPLFQLAANSIRSNLRLAINHLSGPQGQRLRDDATRLHAMPQRQQHSTLESFCLFMFAFCGQAKVARPLYTVHATRGAHKVFPSVACQSSDCSLLHTHACVSKNIHVFLGGESLLLFSHLIYYQPLVSSSTVWHNLTRPTICSRWHSKVPVYLRWN